MYAKTEQYHAAVSSGLTFINDYPKSEYLEEIHYILVKNSYLLSKNSIESKKMERIEDTFERYRTFVELFPELPYMTIDAMKGVDKKIYVIEINSKAGMPFDVSVLLYKKIY